MVWLHLYQQIQEPNSPFESRRSQCYLKTKRCITRTTNIENTKNSARNTFTAMRRKEPKGIVLKYDKDASPDVYVKAIVGYYKYDVIDA